MSADLTILCVTAGGSHAWPFIAEMEELADLIGARYVEFDGAGARCIEYVLDDAIAQCDTEWILRLDDDERCSDAMRDWLAAGSYRDDDHWCFPRAHLYPDAEHYVTSQPLWPDLQTRLSVKEKAGDRPMIHQGSPYGTGTRAPVVLEHHKFLIRGEAERRELVSHYETIHPGSGTQFAVFSLPELYELDVAPYESATVAA